MRISSEKKLLTNESCFIFQEITTTILLSDKRNQQLSANLYKNEARTYFTLTTGRFRMFLLCDVVFKLVYMVPNKECVYRMS